MIEIVGRRGTTVLFSSDMGGVLIDESKNVVLGMGDVETLFSSVDLQVDSTTDKSTEAAFALAKASLTSLSIEVLSSNDRMHTIPKSVTTEAKRALEWRKEHGRGGTPVGLNTARTLAEGGQIGIKKIRHIAKYFPRHEVDKKGKGYTPDEDGYPSNGRIAWALWGGDAAQKWASAIVKRENKKSVTASADYINEPEKISFGDFSKENIRFAVRMRKNQGFDRLYKIDELGNVCVWDDGSWDSLGNIENDIDTYDRALDDPYDQTEKFHVPVDARTAVTIAALFDSDPFCAVTASAVNPEEWSLFSNAVVEIDWDEIASLTAAGKGKGGGKKKKGDGNYTEEERSENAQRQARDAVGKFAEAGSRVVINNNPVDVGVITKLDQETKMATVTLDNGQVVEVPINTTKKETPSNIPAPEADPSAYVPSVDITSILGEPKTETDKYIARIAKAVEPMGLKDFKEIMLNIADKIAYARSQAPSGPSPEYKEALKGNKKYVSGLLGKNYDKYMKSPISAAATPASEKPQKDDFKKPEESDVKPLYFAIVANDDPQAVLDIVALTPKGPKTTAAMTFKRSPGKWERDDSILEDLNSPTPPPVVQLDEEMLEDVIKQVDSAVTASLVSSGGATLNGQNANKLRNYWLNGEGASKIVWGSSGDWSRCVSNLAKYMGPESKGYCALRHKEATGMWTENSQEMAITASGAEDFNSFEVLPEDIIVEQAISRARIADAKRRVLTAGGDRPEDGSKFVIALVIPEAIESGDGRIFDKEAIDIRELPLPLLWQIRTGEGHNGSVVVGRIDHMERTDKGIGNAYGYFDKGEYGKEAERLVRGGFIRGVSADLDKFEASEDTEHDENSGDKDISPGRIKIKKARVMAVTLVPKPAFQECTIRVEEAQNQEQEDEVIPDGIHFEDVDPIEASALVACGITAGIIPTTPPSDWFDNPKLRQATPLTVDDEGRVFGHIAAWHVDHIGMSFGTKPPRSRSNYSYFHTGVVRADNGKDYPVGQLTLAGGHASLEMSAHQAVRHYDDTASAIADVHAGEDSYGIWVAGALRPGTSPEQIRALRASAPSGDWRPIKGHLELVAVCQVNVPGFPIARARVASGQVMALVAAGASALAHMKSDPVAELQARIDRLERQPLEMAMDNAKSRVLSVKAEELAAKMKKAKKEISEDDVSWMMKSFDGDTDPEDAEADALSIISNEERKKLAKKGQALPDGSYPIRNASDLKNAIRAFGRAKASERAKVRKHIVKRARALGKTNLIPENWPEAPKKSEASVDAIPSEGIMAAGDGPCWDGYEMIGYKEKNGKKVPNCVPIDAAEDPIVASVRERLEIIKSLVSAGGADRNRGNAETLRRYWTSGEGAAKIRWGTPGDWKRCVRYLAKYMGPRSKGYCQLRHKDATGVYTGSRLNPGRNNSVISEQESSLSEALYDGQIPFITEITEDELSTPMDWIMEETDPEFDPEWEPEEDIIIILIDFDDFEKYEKEEHSTEFAADADAVDLAKDLSPEEIEAIKLERLNRARQMKVKKKGKYTAATQPRDTKGKFRQVLARLKLDLGVAGLDKAIENVEEIENLDFSGDYEDAAKASQDLIGIIDRLDTGALNSDSIENIRASSAELGRVIANLPFAFGEQSEKIRFSDVPPAMKDLIRDMITRVEKKIGKEDSNEATAELRTFMSGGDYFSQSDISSQMSKLLRLLT